MRCELATIVIMTYKNLDQIEKTVLSAAEQDYENMEVVISDDGTPGLETNADEKISGMCRRCGLKNFKIILNRENAGTVRHFNTIIKRHTQGSIIIPLSCGDKFYDKSAVSSICNYFSTTKHDILTAKRIVDLGGKKRVFPSSANIARLKEPKKTLWYLMANSNFISGSSTCYRRNVFEKYGYFNEHYRLLEDYPYYIMLLLQNVEIGFLDRITIEYQLGGISNNKTANPKLVKDYHKLTLYKYENCRDEFPLVVKRAIQYRYLKIRETDPLKKLLLRLKYFDIAVYLRMNTSAIM